MTRRRARDFAAPLLIVLILMSGCDASVDSKSDVELAYLEQIRIKDHKLVHSFFEKSAIGIYVGVPSGDIGPLVVGPKLKMEQPPEFDFSSSIMDHVADGTGYNADNVECHASFYRVREGVAPFPNWHLSKDQKRDVRSGRSEVIEVELGCAPFGG